ncbi:MAG TPA: hypothetical protein PKA58_32150, partial [Polyangium sp.]|nr:hypothetical protein [Polyangium sp.]
MTVNEAKFVRSFYLTTESVFLSLPALRALFVLEEHLGKGWMHMHGQVSPRRSLGFSARWSASLIIAFAAGCGGAPEGDVDAIDKGNVNTPEAVASEEFTGGERAPRATVFTPSSDAAEQIALATELSWQVLQDNLESLGLNGMDEVQVRTVWIDDLGMA